MAQHTQASTARATPGEHAAQVEMILGRIDALPTLSPIATRLLALTSSDESDFDEIVSLIEADLSLTTRMLALCRRAALGAGMVTTVRRAVVLLGLEAVQSAVLSVSVFDVLTGPSAQRARGGPGVESKFDHVGFWQHSLAVACAADLLARQHADLKVRPDEAFTAGLVHDLGKVALEWILPQAYPNVITLAEQRTCDLATAERAVLGVDHHIAGKRLAEHWGLPYVLGDTMWLHAQPLVALPDVPHRSLIAIVTAADGLARRLHLGWSGNGMPAPRIETLAQEAGLRVDRILPIEPKLHELLAQRCADLGLADLSSPELMMQSIASANGRLHRLTQSLARRAQASRRQSAGLEVVGSFLTRAQQCGSVEELLAAIAWSFSRLASPPPAARGGGAAPARPLAIVFQSRPGEKWMLWQPSGDGAGARAVEPPRGPADAPADLVTVAGDGSIGAAADLLAWLEGALGPAGRTGALRESRRVPILTGHGAAALLLHEGAWPEAARPGDPPNPAAATLTAAWSAAISSVVRQAGARRLSEALAHANRTVVEAQQRLTETQSLARLGELTAGAAHEMNNPLTIMSGRSQLLAQRLTRAEDRADAQAIAEAAASLTGLITALHALARPPEPKIRGVNLREMLEAAAKRAKSRVSGERGDPTGNAAAPVRITVTGSPELAAMDPELFGRAIEELVVNALQSSPATKVDVTAKADVPGDVLTICVRDDGVGMSEHAVAHAFDPFFSEKTAGRQRGLGLPTARRFVGLHGGEIGLTSLVTGPRRGTTVTVTLPRWRFDRRAAPRPAPAPSAAA